MSRVLFALLFLCSTAAYSEVKIGPRHIFILYPGQDTLWGSYLFVVNNDGQAPEAFRFPVMLPKETVDFQAQDSLSPQELKLGTDGGVVVDKVFPPGETLLQVGFKLPGTEGQAKATIRPHVAYDTLGVFVWQDTLSVSGPEGLEIQKGANLSGRLFDTYSVNRGEAGKEVVFSIGNVPEGRQRLWIIGSIFGAVLFLGGIFLGLKTRPKLSSAEDIS